MTCLFCLLFFICFILFFDFFLSCDRWWQQQFAYHCSATPRQSPRPWLLPFLLEEVPALGEGEHQARICACLWFKSRMTLSLSLFEVKHKIVLVLVEARDCACLCSNSSLRLCLTMWSFKHEITLVFGLIQAWSSVNCLKLRVLRVWKPTNYPGMESFERDGRGFQTVSYLHKFMCSVDIKMVDFEWILGSVMTLSTLCHHS